MIKKRKKPWNYGKAIGQKKPLTPNQVRLIKQILDAEGNLRDSALFFTAIDTMLRGVDLLALTVDDVMTIFSQASEKAKTIQSVPNNTDGWSKNGLVMPGLNQKNTVLTVCDVPKPHWCLNLLGATTK